MYNRREPLLKLGEFPTTPGVYPVLHCSMDEKMTRTLLRMSDNCARTRKYHRLVLALGYREELPQPKDSRFPYQSVR
jgi:hypothetical protein